MALRGSSSSLSLSKVGATGSGGDSGFNVVDEDVVVMESSASDVALEAGEFPRVRVPAAESRRARIVCTMWDSEKGRCKEGVGVE